MATRLCQTHGIHRFERCLQKEPSGRVTCQPKFKCVTQKFWPCSRCKFKLNVSDCFQPVCARCQNPREGVFDTKRILVTHIPNRYLRYDCKYLRAYFEKFGTVISIMHPRGPNATVLFASTDDALKVLKAEHVLDGTEVYATLVKAKDGNVFEGTKGKKRKAEAECGDASSTKKQNAEITSESATPGAEVQYWNYGAQYKKRSLERKKSSEMRAARQERIARLTAKGLLPQKKKKMNGRKDTTGSSTDAPKLVDASKDCDESAEDEK
eukprot:NODE_1235_length_1017_cov_299.715909_g949_i0.p1 GENE.NODE_1235_length_1017_cov_299.715909_g949_i0~~NODE_1235_length_1017_cov_299.715909_g949_i0.p1  ORF type:complete len:285 (+),score=67.27 NODE_1235_length_1017_cov_299.715909_g949_i0:57-857(+)